MRCTFRQRRQNGDSKALGDCEAVVPALNVFVAYRHVRPKTTGEGQHLPPLTRYVRSEIPGVSARKESGVRYLKHLRAPPLLSLNRGLEPRPIALAHVVQHLSYPISLKLRAGRSIGKSVRAVRAIDKEEIREAGGRHSQMGSNALRPLILQSPAVRAPDINAGQPTRHWIKPSSQNKDIQVVFAG